MQTSKVLDDASSSFSIPLILTNDFNWETNRKLKEIYRGRETPSRDRVESITYLGYTARNERIPGNRGATFDVPKYQIEYYDNGAQTKMTCHFGSIHLKEYIAHAVQRQFDPGTTHDDLPYVVAELIVKKEVPKLAEDPSLIIALCDAALMDLHPARLFFDTIKRMKRGGDCVPENVDSVYSFAFEGVQLCSNGVSETIESVYEKIAKSAEEAFGDTLKAEIFRDNVQWFGEVMAHASNLRRNQRGFFTQLVTLPGRFSPRLAKILDALGIPFATNALSKGYFVAPARLRNLKVYPFYPKVFQAISRTFGGKRDCSLYPFCCASQTEETITNEDCVSAPWARVSLPKLCPYAQMWKTWGLADKTPMPVGNPAT